MAGLGGLARSLRVHLHLCLFYFFSLFFTSLCTASAAGVSAAPVAKPAAIPAIGPPDAVPAAPAAMAAAVVKPFVAARAASASFPAPTRMCVVGVLSQRTENRRSYHVEQDGIITSIAGSNWPRGWSYDIIHLLPLPIGYNSSLPLAHVIVHHCGDPMRIVWLPHRRSRVRPSSAPSDHSRLKASSQTLFTLNGGPFTVQINYCKTCTWLVLVNHYFLLANFLGEGTDKPPESNERWN